MAKRTCAKPVCRWFEDMGYYWTCTWHLDVVPVVMKSPICPLQITERGYPTGCLLHQPKAT